MNDKNILYVIDTLNFGGAEKVAIMLANKLTEFDFNVFFCTTRSLGPLSKSLNNKITTFNLGRLHKYDLFSMIKFRRIVLENKIAFVHCHGLSSTYFCVLSLLFFRKVKIICHDHNPLLFSRSKFIERVISIFIHVWICVSKEIFTHVNNNGIKTAVLINNPIDRFIPAKSKLFKYSYFKIAMVANYRLQKNYEFLVNVVQEFTKTYPHINILVTCYGSHYDSLYRKSIQQLIDDLKLSHIIILNSPILDVQEILGNSNAGLLTSTNEGTPISLLEYINCGLPVLVTDVGDCKEIVLKCNCGYVIEVNNVRQFSSHLFQLINNYDQFKINAPYARQVIETTYGIDSVIRNYTKNIYV